MTLMIIGFLTLALVGLWLRAEETRDTPSGGGAGRTGAHLPIFGLLTLAPLGCETRAQPWKARTQTAAGCQGAPSRARKEGWQAERDLGSLLRRLL